MMWDLIVDACASLLVVMQVTHDSGMANFDAKSFENYMTSLAISRGPSTKE